MRIVYFATPALAVSALDLLASSAHEVTAVVSRPDRPVGRKRVVTPSPVKTAALERGLKVFTPERAGDVAGEISALADVCVVFAYGAILPTEILNIGLGCVNVHPSDLPRWRGAAPIERAVMAGESSLTIATMAMDEGLDTGDVLLRSSVAIEPTATSGEMYTLVGAAAGPLLLRTLEGLGNGSLQPTPQDHDAATYAEKLTPQGCEVDWSEPARIVDGLIRGANPRPGAWTTLDGRRMKLWRSHVRPTGPELGPGEAEAVGDELVVGCGDGAVTILELQPDGSKRLCATDFLRGQPTPKSASWTVKFDTLGT